MLSGVTAHCTVKNEEYFVQYALRAALPFVEKILVFDTGSTDRTFSIVEKLAQEFPHKIILEQKGPCDKKRHTALRNEMIERTDTAWCLILDGDEIWTREGFCEVQKVIKEGNPKIDCLVAPFYLCVGDVFHYSTRGKYRMFGREEHFSPKIFRKKPGMHFGGDYGEGDFLVDSTGSIFYNEYNTHFLKNKFWHLSALNRSSRDEEVTLGRHKAVMTYSLKCLGMGFSIPTNSQFPEVFQGAADQRLEPLPLLCSWRNLYALTLAKCRNFFL